MLEFLSLFFGLMTGNQTVELAVTPRAAVVELVLDGRSVASIQGPPWTASIDLGPKLVPHELTARAVDAGGHEIARAREWVNLPHPLAKLDLVLEGDPGVSQRTAKVSWKNLRGATPAKVSVSFDGSPLPLDASGRAVLPAHDVESPHLVSAVVSFPGGYELRRDLAIGGALGNEVSTELTGVPVRVRGDALPSAPSLAGWFTSAGAPLTVAAVEAGPAFLYVVRSAADVSRMGTKGVGAGHVWRAPLGKDQFARLISPFGRRFMTAETLTDLFEISPPIDTREGFPFVVGYLTRPLGGGRAVFGPSTTRRIADAVASTAQEAVSESRRRALLLVISGNERDESRYDPTTVREYLAALRVPLFVWCLAQPAAGSPLSAWGRCQDVTSAPVLRRGIDEIREELDAQRIVIVEGRHLPQSIGLSPAARGVELLRGDISAGP